MEGRVRRGDSRGSWGQSQVEMREPQGMDDAWTAFSLADIVVCKMRDTRAMNEMGQAQSFR